MMRLLRQLFWVFVVLGLLVGIILLFSYDIIKIEWVSFMEIQPSYEPMENPLQPPPRSIPIEGPAFLLSQGPPDNPVPADDVSVARGEELYSLHCQMCHGTTGEGTGPIAAFLVNFKPANLTSEVVHAKSDGSIFLTITFGIEGKMPPLNENLTVRERWDVVNYIRTLQAEPAE
jgi:mono/diheme cytochrome c family protein